MNLFNLGKIAGALALTIGLAGCMDVTMDVAVQNETNGKLTTTMVMGADFYEANLATSEKGGPEIGVGKNWRDLE